MTDGKELERLRKRLRAKLDGAAGDVAVPAQDLRTVLEEIGRLQQSSDRLRRQNRRLRIKLQKAGIPEDAEDGGDAGPADGDPADGGAGSR